MTPERGFICGTAEAALAEVDVLYNGSPDDEPRERGRRGGDGVAEHWVPEAGPAPPRYGLSPSMKDYDSALGHFAAHPQQTGGLSHLRALAIAGLRAGSLRAHDVLCRIRPAAVAVTVLTEPEVGDAGRLIAARIRAVAGDSPSTWGRLLDSVGIWEGTLLALLTGEETASPATSLPPSRPMAWTGHLWRPENVLMALAPRECVQRYFLEGAGRTAVSRAGSAQRAVGFMPLCRGLVDHVMSAEKGRRARANLAANAFTPDAVLALLLRRAGEPAIGSAVRLHDFAGGAVRNEAFLAVRDRPESMRESLEALLDHGQQRFLDLLAAASDDDAAWIHTLVTLAGYHLEPNARRAAYLRLAAVSGPEVVWSVELALVGSLAAMVPEVRDSMARGSVAPLAEAAGAEPFRDPEAAVTAAAGALRREELLDLPLPWLD